MSHGKLMYGKDPQFSFAALRMQFTDLINRVRSFCSRIQVVRDWKYNRSQVGISEHSF